VLPSIEALRAGLHAYVDSAFDDVINRISATDTPTSVNFKSPTFEDGHDHRNKNGQNLTARGAEILYRAFDEGAGYNRAAKLLSISQGAAKNRKAMWAKLGGKNRAKSVLDIDTM
jgi:hypothetical protein